MTLEMKSYVDQSGIKGSVGSVQGETMIAASSFQQDTRLLLLVEKLVNWVEKLVDRVEKLGKGSRKTRQGVHPPPARMKNHQAREVQHTYGCACWNCGKTGYLAQNCLKKPSQPKNPNQGN